ncbi:hypothetical protein ACFFUB_02285 [Algimonas porphyrae]|nr:hypothetical protein [Algimonas porphyrae]
MKTLFVRTLCYSLCVLMFTATATKAQNNHDKADKHHSAKPHSLDAYEKAYRQIIKAGKMQYGEFWFHNGNHIFFSEKPYIECETQFFTSVGVNPSHVDGINNTRKTANWKEFLKRFSNVPSYVENFSYKKPDRLVGSAELKREMGKQCLEVNQPEDSGMIIIGFVSVYIDEKSVFGREIWPDVSFSHDVSFRVENSGAEGNVLFSGEERDGDFRLYLQAVEAAPKTLDEWVNFIVANKTRSEKYDYTKFYKHANGFSEDEVRQAYEAHLFEEDAARQARNEQYREAEEKRLAEQENRQMESDEIYGSCDIERAMTKLNYCDFNGCVKGDGIYGPPLCTEYRSIMFQENPTPNYNINDWYNLETRECFNSRYDAIVDACYTLSNK